MNLRYYIDPETHRPHIYGHGVEEHEVEQVVRSPEKTDRDEMTRRVAIGQTLGGRYLRVIYKRDMDSDSVFIITAYELTGRPLTAYRRRMRRGSG